MLVLAHPGRPILERWYARRLAARRARGTDAWADELRSLESYTPSSLSLILTGLGTALLIPAINEAVLLIRTLVAGN